MLRGTTRRTRVVAALLAVAAAGLVAAAPAGAYLRDIQAISVLTPTNSQTSKSLNFVCPQNKNAIGALGTVPPISNLAISGLWVFFGQRAVFDRAQETDSEASRWALTTRAWCATNTNVKPNIGGAGPYVKRVVIARNQSSTNSNGFKSVRARCPSGSPNVIGGGAAIDGATNDVALESLHRDQGGTALQVRAHETDATGASWAIEAHAICADITSAPNQNVYADGLTNTESASGASSLPKTVTATCPAGRVIVGGAALTYSPATGFPAPPVKVVLKQSRPGGDGASANTWTATAVEVDPTGASWQLRVRAVCAVPNGSFA